MGTGVVAPRGHYYAREAGRLAGVSGDAIGQWGRYGFIRASQSDEWPKIYSFQDVGEAMLVHDLLEAGVKHEEIRLTVAELRKTTGSDWPLSQAQLRITLPDPTQPSARRRKGERERRPPAPWLLASGRRYFRPAKDPAQEMFAIDVDTVSIRKDLDRGGWIVRQLPNLRYIEVNPDRLSGRPAIRGRRIAAEDVAKTAATPGGWDTLREGYDLRRAQINDAVRWWDAVQEYEAA